MDNKKNFDDLVAELSKGLLEGKPLTGKDGVFTPLLKKVIEASLEGEMDAHLASEDRSATNRRNGKGRKNLSSSLGELEIFTPRDRDGSSTPETIKKRQRRISEDIDAKILSPLWKRDELL